jgi:hypothetical protein
MLPSAVLALSASCVRRRVISILWLLTQTLALVAHVQLATMLHYRKPVGVVALAAEYWPVLAPAG